MEHGMMQPIYDFVDMVIQVSVILIAVFVVVAFAKAFVFKQETLKKEGRKKTILNAISPSGHNNIPINLTLELLQQIEWKIFENVCCAYFVERGFISKTTKVGADGGVDIELFKQGSAKPAIIVQCKAYNKNVGVKDIREFYGVLAASEATSSIFMTVKGFTPDAKAFAEGKSPALQLCDGQRLMKMIKKLPDDAQKRLLKVATKGDYKTPTCASCDIKMVVRSGKNGNFFGCRNYPRCKMTMVLKS